LQDAHPRRHPAVARNRLRPPLLERHGPQGGKGRVRIEIVDDRDAAAIDEQIPPASGPTSDTY